MPVGLIDDVIARLKANVPALGNRVEGALDLAAMMRDNRLPDITPAAHVIPGGFDGGAKTELTGQFRQETSRLVTVMLTVRSHDRAGEAAMEDLDGLIEGATLALIGWSPSPETGVFALRRSRLAAFNNGAAVYDITFALPDQLRSTP